MKKNSAIIKTGILLLMLMPVFYAKAQTPPNWTQNQLTEPSSLSEQIKSGKDVPLVLSVGPGAVIPNSVNLGMASTPEGLSALTAKLGSLPKDKKIVIYCGCCPFEHCPNVRPAIALLKKENFTNYSLLNLPHNVKTDWIDKGYPVKE